MKTYLVTGGAGFIGSNFVLYMLNKYQEIRIVNVDKLTYAGNLENLKSIEGDSRHVFVQADICDRAAMEALFGRYDFDYVINFAAETHVDRSITGPEVFVATNIGGTMNLLQCAKNAWCRDGAWAPGRLAMGIKIPLFRINSSFAPSGLESPARKAKAPQKGLMMLYLHYSTNCAVFVAEKSALFLVLLPKKYDMINLIKYILQSMTAERQKFARKGRKVRCQTHENFTTKMFFARSFVLRY